MARTVSDPRLVQIEAPVISLRGNTGTEYGRLENGVGIGILGGGVAPSAWQSGRYYGLVQASTSNGLTNGLLRAYPFWVPGLGSITLSRIAAEITGAGDSGCKLRLGIYADDGTGRPGNLLIDAGTIDGTSVAVQEITISQTITCGRIYHAAAVVELVSVTQPTVRTIAALAGVAADYGTSLPSAAANAVSYFTTGVTGALPSAFGTPGGVSALAPRLLFKVA